jgi:toxin YoeB
LACHSGNALPSFDPWDERIDPTRIENTGGEVLPETQLVVWKIVFTSQAQKDAKKLKASGKKPKAESILAVLRENPFQNPPPYEKLVGDLAGAYSRRIDIQHRLVYEVLKRARTVKVIRLWTHYE